jgi:ZIP family zinc transporter
MRTYDALLGFAAGVMTAIATFGLIAEASAAGSPIAVLAGLALGALALHALDRFLPHEHVALWATDPQSYRRGLLLLAALTLHNIPEGLAVGTSYIAQPRLGFLIALAIAMHNIPEGIAIAGPFRVAGMRPLGYVGWALASGMAEPIAAFAGAGLVTLWSPLMPISMAFAAGAMLYVVSDELIPESHSHGFEHEATFGFILGFMLLIALRQWLL